MGYYRLQERYLSAFTYGKARLSFYYRDDNRNLGAAPGLMTVLMVATALMSVKEGKCRGPEAAYLPPVSSLGSLTKCDTLRKRSPHHLMGGHPVIYEFRLYETMPGKADALARRLRDLNQPAFERNGMRLVGAWLP